MNTALQKGQKVISPDGTGLIEEINGEEIRLKLENGDVKTYSSSELEDDSAGG